MIEQTRPPLRYTPRSAAEDCNPDFMTPWHGSGLQSPPWPPSPDPETGPIVPPPLGRLQRPAHAAGEWLADWHEDLIVALMLFAGAYLILMLLGAAERADLLAGWL